MDDMTREALLTSLDYQVEKLALQLGLTVAELLDQVATRIRERGVARAHLRKLRARS